MTITTEKYVEWLKVAFNADGTVSRAWTEEVTVIRDGDAVTRIPGPSVHVEAADVSAHVPEATLLAQIGTLTAERDAKIAELAAAQETLTQKETALTAAEAQIASLQEQIAQLQNPTAGDASSVTALQARRALKTVELDGGGTLLAAVRTYMDTLEPDDDERMFFDWALTWERSNPVLIEMAGHFGLSSDAIDALFALAKTL